MSGTRPRERDRRPHAAAGPDEPPRHRRGGEPAVDRLDGVGGRRRLRRLDQPAQRRRIRQGEHGAGRRARPSRSTASTTPGTYYVVVRALDATGNASAPSNEAHGLPHLVDRLGEPPVAADDDVHVISAVNRTDNVYGQVWIDGVTSQPGPTPSLIAQLGFGPDGSNPAGNAAWQWVDAAFNTDAGNNDEFVASLLPETAGTFDYAYRYSVTGGRDWVYADLDGIGNGYSTGQAGSLTVTPSDDTTAPGRADRAPRVQSASPAGIELGLGCRRRRPEPVRLRGAPRRRVRRAVRADRRRRRRPTSPTRRSTRARRTGTSSARSTRRSTARPTRPPSRRRPSSGP